ncbi:hypothetical protein [Erythrobacter sp. R86502]|uniref:hypothetical protein n=1 Tax=Erythrobacter sp. R86502 TaxID=3093846 RepID=UPI0036D3D9EC
MNTELDVVALHRGLATVLARLMDLPSPPIKNAPFAVGAIMYDEGDDLLELVMRSAVTMKQDLLVGVTKRRSSGELVRSLVLVVADASCATAYNVEPARLKQGQPVLLVSQRLGKAWHLVGGQLRPAAMPSAAKCEAGILRAAAEMPKLLDYGPEEEAAYPGIQLRPKRGHAAAAA